MLQQIWLKTLRQKRNHCRTPRKFDATEGSHPDLPGTVDKPGAAENAELAAAAASSEPPRLVNWSSLLSKRPSLYSVKLRPIQAKILRRLPQEMLPFLLQKAPLKSAEAAEKFALSSKKLAQTAADLAAILNPEPVSPDELKQQLLADQAQVNFARAEKDAELAKQIASEQAAAQQAEQDKQNADINAEVSVVKILASVEIISEKISLLSKMKQIGIHSA